ncbi:MAG TPA: DNA polymerase III subunit gamma/tau [Terriglobales bacterium]|nr:DNA polymerase III subunit gamma/tau [Terriglobales bacterium]
MAYQVLARKYRPQSFADVIGQEHVTRTLKNAIEQQRIAHGYIFSGHRGIGKTTVARILAMCLNCRGGKEDRPQAEPCGKCDSCTEIRASSSVDVIEIDAATNRGIDEIRELRDSARYRPARDRYKIYILDEAHQITDAAFNALLKTLEEPPSHIVFMMATTQPEDIPQTIRSRCQHFSFHAVRFDEIVNQLTAIAQQEKIKADRDAIALLAEAGDGSMRDALSIMDQAIACCGETLTGEVVQQLVGTVPGEVLEKMMEAVAANSSQDVLRLVDKLVTEGQSPTHFTRQLVRFLRNAMVAKVAGGDSALLQISSDERARVARTAELFSEEDLTRFLQIMLRTHGDVSYKSEQRFHLELGLLKLVHAQRLLPLEELLSGATVENRTQSVPSAPASQRAATPPCPSPFSHESGGTSRSERPSPFERDRARQDNVRKTGPEMSSSTPVIVAGSSALAVAVAEALPEEPSAAELQPSPAPVLEREQEREPQAQPAEDLVNRIRSAVLEALEKGGQHTLLSNLETGQWSIAGNELVVQVAVPATFLDMAMTNDANRLVTAAINSAAKRMLKLRLESTARANGAVGAASGNAPPPARSTGSSGSARSRAADDPVVRHVQEKFAAEIRTVIDHREKRS